jgi:flagellar motor switch protein FliN/FliY
MEDANVFGEAPNEPKVVFGENIGDSSNARIEYNRLKLPALENAQAGGVFNPELFGSIPVEVTAELGKAKLTLQEVLELNEGAIIELQRTAGEPLDLVVNGQLIAQGEVVAVDDKYALKISKIMPSAKE